ncbi:MAG TPA: hypothetical protein DCG42_09925 [Maribacter sp.]|jgi:hypothetical protein|nr:hypothetical protein [Maribacter sp.]|tara:strand:- start:972 stop:1634 length:663 start_codon:yes stop_codon:yes gene_type:complete
MKLLMENWRQYLTEISVFEKDAAVNTVLDRMGKSEFYPEVDDARVFVNRQAAMLMARVPMVWQMIKVINQDPDITEQDVLEILLQRALKGRTFEALTKSEQEYMEKYGLKYPEEKEEEEIEIPQYTREDIPPEMMDAGTQVFVPSYAKREGLIREGKDKEDKVTVADALLSLALNANMQGGIGPQVLFKMSEQELKQQIQIHNHRKDEISDEELYNYIRG